MSAEVTVLSRRDQAMAIWARVWPRLLARSLSSRTSLRFSPLKNSFEKEPSEVAREVFGTPLRYLSVRRPCASGEKEMHPTPSSSRVSRRPSAIQRLSMEYEG